MGASLCSSTNKCELFSSTVGNANLNYLKLRTLPMEDTIELVSFTFVLLQLNQPNSTVVPSLIYAC